MLIHLSELFNCEGRKKVYTVETTLDSVDFDGETFQIEKAEPFELELTAKTRHKYTMSGHATLTVVTVRVVWSQYLSTANWILDESLRCRTVRRRV